MSFEEMSLHFFEYLKSEVRFFAFLVENGVYPYEFLKMSLYVFE